MYKTSQESPLLITLKCRPPAEYLNVTFALDGEVATSPIGLEIATGK